MKLSVIIPVYNAGKYLRRCLDSILVDNGMAGMEVVCVNDGSKDDSLQILQEYAREYASVKVVDQKNAGVSAARNRGMEMAQGEYIMFADADDYISAGTILPFVAITEESGSDLAIAGMVRVSHAGQAVVSKPGEKVYGKSDLWRITQELGHLHIGTPWVKLFKRSIIAENSIKFDTSMAMMEDAAFVYSYLQHCSKAVTSDIVLYNYVVNDSNATSKYHGESFFSCLSKYRNAQFECLNNLNPPLDESEKIRSEIDSNTAFQALFSIYSIYRAWNRPKNKYHELKMHLSEYQHIVNFFWGG